MAEDVGTLLLRAGLIDEATRQRALARAFETKLPLLDVFVDSGIVNEADLCGLFRARLFVKEAATGQLMALSQQVLDLIPAETAIEHRVLPLSLDAEGNLTIAMADPTDVAAVDEIAFFTGKYINRTVVPLTAMRAALVKYFPDAPPSQSFAVLPPGDNDFEKTPINVPAPRLRSPRIRPATAPELRPRAGELRAKPLMPIGRDTGPTIVLDQTLVEPESPSEEALTRPINRPANRAGRDTLVESVGAVASAPPSTDEGTPMGALVTLLQDLTTAGERDDVIRYMLGYLLTTHGKADFLLVRGTELQVWDSSNDAAISLERASIFSEVISTRSSYAGSVSPEQGRMLAVAAKLDFQSVLIMPVIIRDRVVGLFYASRAQSEADEHTRVAVRAAGQALERLLIQKQLDAKGPYST